ncbi:MAG TPA: peptidylprolyl isomerase [Calidithermus sp.]|jgi:FKBP-type peptidyl-prolyl cis-trans isomerase SlyD|nr:peptidylprolyl isomerase [Calidithermus sp.]
MRYPSSLLRALLLLAAWGPPASVLAQNPAPTPAPKEGQPMSPVIDKGATVRFDYTLTDEAGALLDSSEGRAPLTYVHGRREIIPGLERQLAGMRAGEEKDVVVPPAEAYGPVDPSAVAEVPKRAVPAEALVPGTELMARSPDGQSRVVRVKEVREDSVLLDLNHPLAGKTLYFHVRIREVTPAGP